MKKQKPWIIAAGFGAVIVLGLGTFALAMSTFPERLRAPFHLLSADELKSLSQSRTAEEELFTSTKDTDRDGIPDAQELQIYRTSPFLEDTDSDGIIDKAEIEAGTDPNCPKGTDCRALALPSARETEQNEITKSLYQTSITAKLEKIGVPGFSDPASIRNFLRQAGVSEDVLSQFDDAALRKMFEQAAAQSGIAPVSGPQNQEPQIEELPKNPSPQAIRDLLLQGGIDKNLLAKFTDEQIVKLYQETLKDVNKK